MSSEVHISLREQEDSSVELDGLDAEYLSNLQFRVVPCRQQDQQKQLFIVNSQQYVGHFRLPSGAIVTITPKIPTASVLRMLAYVYLRWRHPVFRDEEVGYQTDSFLFEPLISVFNDLVAFRARRGLMQEYVRHEENRPILRGRILLREHIQQNTGYPNRAFCRFFENTVDIPDNQAIKLVLHRLIVVGGWTRGTSHRLRANLQQFEGVSLISTRAINFGGHHYHRLNEDYRPIHALCALFLATSSISEKPGQVPFKGFLLDMNKLFEKFVEQAFVNVASDLEVIVLPQRRERLSDGDYIARIQPDILVIRQGVVCRVVDAKYKRDYLGPENSDLFQVISYGTVLRCNETYLFYPETELSTDRRIHIRNSQIVVNMRRVAISGPECIWSAERSVRAAIESPRARSLIVPHFKAPHAEASRSNDI
jgi:5-methylcytosine-specific restriction enzyme subunit McrC